MNRLRPVLAAAAGLALLVVLAVIVHCAGQRPAPVPRPSTSPVAVTATPTSRPSPTLRPPTLIVTPPPTATPCAVCAGEGKG